MSRVPGVAGGDYQRARHLSAGSGAPRAASPEAERKEMMEEDEDGDDPQAAAAPMDDELLLREDDCPAFAPDENDDEYYAEEDGQKPPTAEEEDEEEAPEQEELDPEEAQEVEGDIDAQREVAPAEAQVATSARVESVGEFELEDPERKCPRRAAGGWPCALSADEEAPVKTMPFDRDLLQMFLTYKMADTLHDCQNSASR